MLKFQKKVLFVKIIIKNTYFYTRRNLITKQLTNIPQSEIQHNSNNKTNKHRVQLKLTK